MNTTFTALAVSVAILLSAAGATAQDARNPQPDPQTTNPAVRQPPPQETGRRDQQDQTGRQQTSTPFEKLDRDTAGYLTRDTAGRDPWLEQNFDRCDVNHDDRITREEYQACTRMPMR